MAKEKAAQMHVVKVQVLHLAASTANFSACNPPPPIIFGLGSVHVCVPVCVTYACVCVCKHAHTLLLEGVTAV